MNSLGVLRVGNRHQCRYARRIKSSIESVFIDRVRQEERQEARPHVLELEAVCLCCCFLWYCPGIGFEHMRGPFALPGGIVRSGTCGHRHCSPGFPPRPPSISSGAVTLRGAFRAIWAGARVGKNRPIADFLAELGKLMLMFSAGLEIDLELFRRVQRRSMIFRADYHFVATNPRHLGRVYLRLPNHCCNCHRFITRIAHAAGRANHCSAW